MNIVDLHRRMVREVFLNVELRLNEGRREVFEYDVQDYVLRSFERALANTPFSAEREKQGKVDCVIYRKTEPLVFYEMKTYFKKSESVKKKDLHGDIAKVRRLLLQNQGCRGFILVAGTKSKLRDVSAEGLGFISAHLCDGNKEWATYSITKNEVVRLRPSRKEHRGTSALLTWEVMLS